METTEQYPYVLITGSLLEHFNTGEMSRRSAKLSKLRPASHLDMNPADAQADRLMENDTVRITSPHGSVHSFFEIHGINKKGTNEHIGIAPYHEPRPYLTGCAGALPV